MQTRGKRFTVLGAGKSGLASVRLLLKHRGRVFVSDSMKAYQALRPGGCIVDTRAGAIDAQIETQLSEIKRNFLE